MVELHSNTVQSITDPRLDELCHALKDQSCEFEDFWPESQLKLCGEFGVYRWFLPTSVGGFAWNATDITKGYLRLSASCLTTTFVITQRMGACRRIANSANHELQQKVLPKLIDATSFSTVGVSHLTTSRRHLGEPALTAKYENGAFLLDGYSPWVTGARYAETVVVGAEMDDGRQVLVCVPTDLPGISIDEPPKLVGLSGSKTGAMRFKSTKVDEKWLVDGPEENVMQSGRGANSGGLQTSTLAAGLGTAAVDFLQDQSVSREDLTKPATELSKELKLLKQDLLDASQGDASCSIQEIRTRANSFVLRATQASLAAAKGSGFVDGHPAGRWCREALFFLVWSCPQPVMEANLCELAGIAESFN